MFDTPGINLCCLRWSYKSGIISRSSSSSQISLSSIVGRSCCCFCVALSRGEFRGPVFGKHKFRQTDLSKHKTECVRFFRRALSRKHHLRNPSFSFLLGESLTGSFRLTGIHYSRSWKRNLSESHKGRSYQFS